MRRAVVLLAVVGAMVGGAYVDAGAGSTNPPPPTTVVVSDDDGDVVTVGIGQGDVPDIGVGGGGGGSDVTTTIPADCIREWQRSVSGRVITWIDDSTGNIMANWVTSCPGIYSVVVRVYRAPTADDLIPGFYGQVIAAIEAPSSAISPPASAPINLGLWLATDGPLEVRRGGTVGPFSVEVVATLADTTFEMGNGDVVVCDGAGVVIVDVDTVEQGPCGYTYRQALAEGSGIVIGGRWEITYSTSLGDGVLDAINTSSTVGYSTYEIQTVGQSG